MCSWQVVGVLINGVIRCCRRLGEPMTPGTEGIAPVSERYPGWQITWKLARGEGAFSELGTQ